MGKENGKGVIEFLKVGGEGSEARVDVELRTRFPGIGGDIITQEGVVTAHRMGHGQTYKSGQRMFLRHMIIKKLEDYFFRKRKYNFAHVPRPLGSTVKNDKGSLEAYLYEWAYGDEGFPWEIPRGDGNYDVVVLRDWNTFVGCFSRTGINMGADITDADDGRYSKNIIDQFKDVDPLSLEKNSIWKRIDFGPQSLPIDYDKLSRFLRDNRNDLINILRNERYEMLILTMEYMTKPDKMSDRNKGRLEVQIADYRRKTLEHHTSRGSGIINGIAYIDKGLDL